jgi:hypothetical protein
VRGRPQPVEDVRHIEADEVYRGSFPTPPSYSLENQLVDAECSDQHALCDSIGLWGGGVSRRMRKPDGGPNVGVSQVVVGRAVPSGKPNAD